MRHARFRIAPGTWLLALWAWNGPVAGVAAETPGYSSVSFPASDGGTVYGSLFTGSDKLGVIFAHGAAFDKESWYPLAQRLQRAGMASLSIDFRGYGRSRPGRGPELYPDLLGAVTFLEQRGYGNIALVGGSMGASAVLAALAHSSDARVKKAILLAPAGGGAATDRRVAKLFVVSSDDGGRSRVEALFHDSSEPKRLKIFPGAAHAQHLFRTEHGPELTDVIVEFLRRDSEDARPAN